MALEGKSSIWHCACSHRTHAPRLLNNASHTRNNFATAAWPAIINLHRRGLLGIFASLSACDSNMTSLAVPSLCDAYRHTPTPLQQPATPRSDNAVAQTWRAAHISVIASRRAIYARRNHRRELNYSSYYWLYRQILSSAHKRGVCGIEAKYVMKAPKAYFATTLKLGQYV